MTTRDQAHATSVNDMLTHTQVKAASVMPSIDNIMFAFDTTLLDQICVAAYLFTSAELAITRNEKGNIVDIVKFFNEFRRRYIRMNSQ
jgi:hypothetical protein